MKSFILIATAGIAATALTGCDKEQYRADAESMCRIYETAVNNPSLPYTDIYAGQYGDAGGEADFDSNGFVNFFELQGFFLNLQAEGYGFGTGPDLEGGPLDPHESYDGPE